MVLLKFNESLFFLLKFFVLLLVKQMHFFRADKIKTQKIAADFASMNVKPSCTLDFKAAEAKIIFLT